MMRRLFAAAAALTLSAPAMAQDVPNPPFGTLNAAAKGQVRPIDPKGEFQAYIDGSNNTQQVDPSHGLPVMVMNPAAAGGTADQTGTSATDGQATSTANQHVVGYNYIFNGSTWDRMRGTGGAANVAVTNFPSIQPVSGSVSVSNFPTTQQVAGTITVGNSVIPVGQYFASILTRSDGQPLPLVTDKHAVAETVERGSDDPLAGITPTVTQAGTSVLGKGSQGNLYSAYAVNGTATSGFLVCLNVSAVPASGAAITPIDVATLAGTAGATASVNYGAGPPNAYSVGVSCVVTTSLTTYTPGGNAFIQARVR